MSKINFGASWPRSRPADGIVGQSTVGPHRSDLEVHHAVHGREASQCSTGEQKALLLAVILGHAQLLTAARRLKPIMLLDEVAAHFDLPRRAALLEALVPLGWTNMDDRYRIDNILRNKR